MGLWTKGSLVVSIHLQKQSLPLHHSQVQRVDLETTGGWLQARNTTPAQRLPEKQSIVLGDGGP